MPRQNRCVPQNMLHVYTCDKVFLFTFLDEVDCELFTIDSSYLKTVPPSPPSKGELARVYIGFDILSILEISEVSNYINLQMVTRLSWRDDRLTMMNLKEDEDLNTLTPEFRYST